MCHEAQRHDEDRIVLSSSTFDRIFQIFQALQPRYERKGPEIGLAPVKKIHGGLIRGKSTPGMENPSFFTLPNLNYS